MANILNDESLRPYLTKSGKTYRFQYESVEDWKSISTSGIEEHRKETDSLIDNHFARQSESWLGVKNWAEFERVMTDGWGDGIKRIYDSLGSLDLPDIQPVSIKRKQRRKDQGDELDIHRIYAGDLEQAWTASERAARSHVGGIIELAVDVGLHCGQHADELFWRAAAMIVLADKLTLAGYNVGIRALNYSVNQNAGVAHTFVSAVVKQPSEPLNINNVAVATALSGFTRLTIIGQANLQPGEIECGHGKPRNIPETDDFVAGALLVSRNVTTLQAAKDWLIQTVSKLSMPLAA